MTFGTDKVRWTLQIRRYHYLQRHDVHQCAPARRCSELFAKQSLAELDLLRSLGPSDLLARWERGEVGRWRESLGDPQSETDNVPGVRYASRHEDAVDLYGGETAA